MSNSLDTDQARHLVGPDLGPNCLKRLSAHDSSRQLSRQCSDLIGQINNQPNQGALVRFYKKIGPFLYGLVHRLLYIR